MLVMLIAAATSMGLLVVAVVEHARTRSHLLSRTLAPAYVNTLLVAVVLAIPAGGTMAGLASEDAGEALLFMAGLGAVAGGASGLLLTPIVIVAVGLVQRRLWRRSGPIPAEASATRRPHPISLSLAACALVLGLAACLSALSLVELQPREWMFLAAPFVLPGLLMAVGALAGRRWWTGLAALVLNLLPVLGLGGAVLWAIVS